MHILLRPKPQNQDWIEQMFECQAVRNGGVIRRQVVDVAREVGINAFVAEVRKRRFHLIRTSQHFIVVCSADPVAVLL